MLRNVVLLAILMIAAPAFGNEIDAVDVDIAADVEAVAPETTAIDAELAIPGVTSQGQLAGGGGRCLHQAIDCGSSTGGCGGKPFWSSCNGGAGVCAEACDSQASGGTICECWSFSFSSWADAQPQIAQLLQAGDAPQCQRSSRLTDAD